MKKAEARAAEGWKDEDGEPANGEVKHLTEFAFEDALKANHP